MADRTRDARVIVLGADARVRAALGALIDATPGLRVVASVAAVGDGLPVVASGEADVAVVDITDRCPERDLLAIRTLAAALTVVAVAASGYHAGPARAAGAAAFCDKDGNADALTEALRAVATRSVRRASDSGRHQIA
jgi:DNA-binding NarL/FixJ family response regulator